MKFIRTFHPIGQGAFYTERHNFNGTEFNMVYDCGSTTLKRNELERKIKSTFPKNHSIDILFISHFHADHINGIEVLSKHCKISKVVIPEVSDEAKTLFKVANLIDGNFSDTRLIDSPENFFGPSVPIIRIRPNENNLNQDSIGLDARVDISKIDRSTVEPSGTVFTPTTGVDWLFIPFNYKQSVRKEQFIRALANYELVLTDIDTIIKIKKHKRNIIKAYNEVDGDLNNNSLILFSGKNTDDQISCFEHYRLFYLHKNLQSGCLYLGDIDLNEPEVVSDIKAKLGKVLPFIGTLQVPHHGSIHNFSNSILQKEDCCAIFSFGIKNTYGHPSDRVIGDVIAKDIYPHLVTEEQRTMVAQYK